MFILSLNLQEIIFMTIIIKVILMSTHNIGFNGDTCTVMILNFRTDRAGQTVQTQIRLLLEEQSDQGLHCLLFHLHLFEENQVALASLFEF